MKKNKLYLLVAESFGIGQILEIQTDEKLARKRIQRFFDIQNNQIDPCIDINTEYTSLRNYQYREDTYFENSSFLFFIQSNGFYTVYIIMYDLDKNVDDIINNFIMMRNK